MADSRYRPKTGADFSLRGVLLAVTIGGITMVLALFFLANQRDVSFGSSAAPPSVDRSALGMRAFFDLLQALDLPARPFSPLDDPAAFDNALVILPDVRRSEGLEAALLRYQRARALLLILPKRELVRGIDRAMTGEAVRLAEPDTVVSALAALSDGPARLWRPTDRVSWSPNPVRIVPLLADPQGISHRQWAPVIDGQGGALLAWLEQSGQSDGPAIFVLADPDPLQNHALDDGANAVFAIALVESLRTGGGPIVFDDSAGAGPPSFWAELFRAPLIGFTLSVVAAFVLLCLSAAARYGTRANDRDDLRAGRDTVLEASAGLVAGRRSHAATVRRYWDQALMAVGRRFQAPASSSTPDLVAYLDSIAARRGINATAAELETACQALGPAVDERSAVRLAQRIHAWRGEMLRDGNR